VVAGGGALVPPAEAEVLVWSVPADPDALEDHLRSHPGIRWVQLPWAGIEPYVPVVQAHPERTWTCGKGVYAEPVAELALTLLLAPGRLPWPRRRRRGDDVDAATGPQHPGRAGRGARRRRHRHLAAAAPGALRVRDHGRPPEPGDHARRRSCGRRRGARCRPG